MYHNVPVRLNYPGNVYGTTQRIRPFARRSIASTAIATGSALYNMARTRSGRQFRGNPRPRRRQRTTGSSNTTTRRRAITSGQGVTAQYDKKLIYFKKSANPRRRRAWKRFSRKVHAVSEKSLGSRTIVKNFQVASDFGPAGGLAGQQMLTELALYPIKHDNKDYLNDIYDIVNNETPGAATDTSTMLFQSAVLDMTVANYSLDEAGAAMPVEIDLYELTSSKRFADMDQVDKDLLQAFINGATSTSTVNGTQPAIQLTGRGVTPWDIPQALAQYRIKILKKTKYQLNSTNSFTYQIRDPKRHTINMQTIKDMDGDNLPGKTRFILMITKPIVGSSVGDGAILRLRTGLTRKYLYKYNSISGKADNLL